MTTVVVVTASTAVYGAELLMLRNIAPLGERGVRVVFAGPPDGAVPTAAADFGTDYIPVELLAARGIRNPDGEGRPSPVALVGELATTVRNAWRLRRALPGDAIVHSNSAAIHFAAALAGRSRRQAVVVHLHDLVRPGLGQKLLGAIVATSSRAVAISEAVRNCVPVRMHDRVSLVPNGVDTTPTELGGNLRSEIGLTDDALVVSYVARFHPNKRQHLLLEAWPSVREAIPTAHLVLVGGCDPSVAWYHDETVQAAEDTEGVSILGRREDVRSILAQSDLLAHPAKAEPFGLGLVEAMAEGCPVLVSRSGGAVEVIVDGVSGVTFEPGDAKDAARRIIELLEDPGLRHRLAEAGRHRAITEFGIGRHADRLVEIYQTFSA